MAERVGRMGGAALALALAVGLVGGACRGGGSDGASPPGPDDGGGWVAAELAEVPAGFVVCEVREDSATGRRISYVHEAEGVGDNCEITVTASTTLYGLDVGEALDVSQRNQAQPPTTTDVAGHRALVGPMTDEGRVYGHRVAWEQAPGLVITVEDARYEDGSPVGTEASALDLASQVVGMGPQRWDSALDAFARSYEYAERPAGATEQTVASGEVDGRPWTLSMWVAPDSSRLAGVRCLRLEYAGASSGPGCATEWEVLDGTGFVTGWGGPASSPGLPSVEWGSTASPITTGDAGLTSLTPRTFPVDGVGEVWVATVPAEACTVAVRRGGAGAAVPPRQLWRLPGDPQAAACAAT